MLPQPLPARPHAARPARRKRAAERQSGNPAKNDPPLFTPLGRIWRAVFIDSKDDSAAACKACRAAVSGSKRASHWSKAMTPCVLPCDTAPLLCSCQSWWMVYARSRAASHDDGSVRARGRRRRSSGLRRCLPRVRLRDPPPCPRSGWTGAKGTCGQASFLRQCCRPTPVCATGCRICHRRRIEDRRLLHARQRSCRRQLFRGRAGARSRSQSRSPRGLALSARGDAWYGLQSDGAWPG